MPKSRIIVTLGALVALLPLLGFPKSWESFFQVFAGLSIVLLSVWATIDRKLSLKAKAQMRQSRKFGAPATPEAPESDAVPSGKRVTDFYPKTGQPGRRLTDLKRTEPSEPTI
jgi:hypothetical protein